MSEPTQSYGTPHIRVAHVIALNLFSFSNWLMVSLARAGPTEKTLATGTGSKLSDISHRECRILFDSRDFVGALSTCAGAVSKRESAHDMELPDNIGPFPILPIKSWGGSDRVDSEVANLEKRLHVSALRCHGRSANAYAPTRLHVKSHWLLHGERN